MGVFADGPQDSSNAVDVVRAADSAALHDAVLAAIGRGWLVSFGRGRDGFAASVSVLDGGEVSRAWCDSAESFQTALDRVVRAANEAGGESAPKKPRRRGKVS